MPRRLSAPRCRDCSPGLSGVAAQPGGAQKLADAARQQTGALGNFANMIGAGGQTSFIEKGSQMLSALLGGGGQTALAGAVGKYAGLGQGASGSLLGMLAPVVMGAVAQQQGTRPLDASGIAGLPWQRALAAARLPLYDVHWTPALVLERPAGKKGEAWRAGLADGRVLRLAIDNAAAQRKLVLNDVVLVHVVEGRGKSAARAELRVRPAVQGTVVVLENRHPSHRAQSQERALRGHDQGAENWACIASLIETCKLNGVDPQTYFADVLTRLVDLWPASRLDELMPWAWSAERSTDNLAA